MGYIRHHTIVIHTDLTGKMQELKNELAVGIAKNLIFGPFVSPVNGTETLIVIPDGSKESWHDSDQGDTLRDAIIRRIESFKYEDNSNSFHYAELISYDEDGPAQVLRHNSVN